MTEETTENQAAAEIVEHLSKKQLKNLRKKQAREEAKKAEEKTSQAATLKKYSLIALGAIIGLAIIYLILTAPKTVIPDKPYTAGPIHWHADVSFTGCGASYSFPKPPPGGMLGPEILHTHDDGRIHIEQQVMRASDITLGKYFKNTGVKFSIESISWGNISFTNGSQCNNGKENKLHMFVNGVENFEFADYVISDTDRIELKYE